MSEFRIDRQELERILGEEFVLNPHIGKEFAYDRIQGKVIIRVLSSIPWRENYNERYLRVCLLHGVTEKILTFFRIPRDSGWVYGLKIRLLQAREEAAMVRYCYCGGMLHLKHGRYGDFIACTKCEIKRNVNRRPSSTTEKDLEDHDGRCSSESESGHSERGTEGRKVQFALGATEV